MTALLMDLRILLSALKCITINVIWDTYRMVCLLREKKNWHLENRRDRNRAWLDSRELLKASVYPESIFEKILLQQRKAYSTMPSD